MEQIGSFCLSFLSYFFSSRCRHTRWPRDWSSDVCSSDLEPLYGKKDLEDDRRFGFGIVTSSDVFRQGVDEIIAKLRDRVGKRALYISVDIDVRSEEHTSELQSRGHLVCRLLLEKINLS